MSVYQVGNAVNIIQRFWSVDPLTEVATPENPTLVVYHLEDPAGTTTLRTFPGDPDITNPETGVFVLRLDPPLTSGDWRYYAVGTGAVEAQSPTELFSILENGLVPSAEPAVPGLPGPLQQWVTAEDLAAVDLSGTIDPSDQRAVDAAYMASQLLYEISGRLWPGIQTRHVRPKRDRCGCWGSSSIAQPWYWTLSPWGGAGWYWRSEGGDQAGCSPVSRVYLAGWPVRDIIEVKIDGVVLDPTQPDQNYRLTRNRWLERMSDPGPPVVPQMWPGCQNMALDDDQPGTFSVIYEWGQAPPLLGRSAAAQLGVQMYLALYGSDECQLPVGATEIVRQGIKIERGLFANFLDPAKSTGLVVVDAFLRAYWRPRGSRRPSIWNPDRQGFARPEGISYGAST